MRSIGKIITSLREEKGYTQSQVCQGICSVAQLAKIEQNQSVPEHFLLDRIFGRLGKTTERLEYVLSKETYRLYELQYQIQREILYRNFENAEEFLKEYEVAKQADRALHRQFIEQEKAQILWICGGETENILEHLERAITETMPSENVLEQGIALSVEELKLLLFRWEVCCGTKYERKLREVWEILDYMENKYDSEELVKVYPYAVLLLTGNSKKQGIYAEEYLLKITENALELLRNEAKILFMPEILNTYVNLLQNNDNHSEKIMELQEMQRALLEVEEEFGVHYERYPLFQHFNRTFELDYELIRNTRLARKVSQEKLCEDVCTQETVSRIERGKVEPTNKMLSLLLKKLKRNRERIGMNIVAERYELIVLEKRIAVAEHRKNGKQEDVLIEKLEKMLNMSVIENRQYVQSMKIRREILKGQYSYQEGIQKLYDCLSMTLTKNTEDIFAYPLKTRECYILNQIALLYCVNNQKEKGIELWKQLLLNLEHSDRHIIFNIRNWELFSGNIAGYMEELAYVDEPIQICLQRLKMELELGKGDGIGRSLAILACVLERKCDDECIKRFRQTLNIYQLMKMEYRYQCIKTYASELGIKI